MKHKFKTYFISQLNLRWHNICLLVINNKQLLHAYAYRWQSLNSLYFTFLTLLLARQRCKPITFDQIAAASLLFYYLFSVGLLIVWSKVVNTFGNRLCSCHNFEPILQNCIFLDERAIFVVQFVFSFRFQFYFDIMKAKANRRESKFDQPMSSCCLTIFKVFHCEMLHKSDRLSLLDHHRYQYNGIEINDISLLVAPT